MSDNTISEEEATEIAQKAAVILDPYFLEARKAICEVLDKMQKDGQPFGLGLMLCGATKEWLDEKINTSLEAALRLGVDPYGGLRGGLRKVTEE